MKAILRVTVLSLFFSSVTGACMSPLSLNPFKKEVVLMSPLQGILVKGGKPLANTEIEVKILMPNGEKRLYSHTSDKDGRFDLPVLKDHMSLGPMTEFAVSQFIFVKSNNETLKIWSAGKRSELLQGEFDTPSEVEGLVCDIDNKSINKNAEKEGIITICQWEKLRRI